MARPTRSTSVGVSDLPGGLQGAPQAGEQPERLLGQAVPESVTSPADLEDEDVWTENGEPRDLIDDMVERAEAEREAFD